MIIYGSRPKLVLDENEWLSGDNMDRYIEQHGMEKAKGYFEAAQDICGLLAEIVDGLASPYHVKTNSEILRQHLENFIKSNAAKDGFDIKSRPENP